MSSSTPRNQISDAGIDPSVVELATDLPISAHIEDLRHSIQTHQVTVLCGETGSGKTTQLPKICLQLGYGRKGLIGHTQPRRIAARSIAARIAEELGVSLGQEVGYQIRHQDKTSKHTQIKLMTDGVLLSEMQHHSHLSQYEVLIIDEAHERSLNIDFILGYLHQLLPSRPDLKVIITSATIDVERFSEHFHQAPVITVAGRTYPVEMRYRPLDDFEGSHAEQKEQALLSAVNELSRENLGDILVFVHGEGEIHSLSKFLQRQKLNNTDVMPLYSRLNREQQAKIFQAHNKRHIILATNVAETSLTIPGISHVIDFGDARVSRYSHKNKIQRLPVEKISQAAARQRAGRCGRTQAGICIRLYSEEDLTQRPAFTEPEILRTNLATVILQMKLMDLGEVADFPFLDVPKPKLVSDGYRLLNELSALNESQALSDIGRTIARFPLDPRLARMLIAAQQYHCVSELCIICSFLSIQDPRERPQDASAKAEQAHQKFHHQSSDFMMMLKLWDFLHTKRKELSRKAFQKLCRTNFLSASRIREWFEMQQQLIELCESMKFTVNHTHADYNNIHCAVVSGLLSHIGKKDIKGHAYQGARNIEYYVFPGSGVFATAPEWIVAAELMETSKLYGRQIAKIDPKWLLKPAKHLLKYEYKEPHWDPKRQAIVVYESVSLYGLPLSVDTLVNYSKHNPQHARELFIQEALVNCQLESSAKFYQHNKKIIDAIRVSEVKSRCFDKLDDVALYQFYEQRLPQKVRSIQSLDAWRKSVEQDDPKHLFLCEEDIIQNHEQEVLEEAYPDKISLGKTHLSVNYDYVPGDEQDGITIDIPVHLLNHLSELNFEANFKGLLLEKTLFLLKKLPKSLRLACQPLPELAEEVALEVSENHLSFYPFLIEKICQRTGQMISESMLSKAALPTHLHLHYRVLNDQGECIGVGDDLISLRSQLSSDARENISNNEICRQGITKWDFASLPKQQSMNVNDSEIILYPALVDTENQVDIQLFSTQDLANFAHRKGLLRLYACYLNKEIKYLNKNLVKPLLLKRHSDYVYPFPQLFDDLIDMVIEDMFVTGYEDIRDKQSFEEIFNKNQAGFISRFQDVYKYVFDVFEQYYALLVIIEELYLPARKTSLDDIREQLSGLIFAGFLKTISVERLQDYPRYLSSIAMRLDKLQHSVEKDQAKLKVIQKYTQHFHARETSASSITQLMMAWEQYRWMVEEFRISLFTQELKPKIKISETKLRTFMEQNYISFDS